MTDDEVQRAWVATVLDLASPRGEYGTEWLPESSMRFIEQTAAELRNAPPSAVRAIIENFDRTADPEARLAVNRYTFCELNKLLSSAPRARGINPRGAW